MSKCLRPMILTKTNEAARTSLIQNPGPGALPLN